jgi:hypothetical protein
MELLITVKAYPSVSIRYGEAVCVAGVRLDTSTAVWGCLFPVAFRDRVAKAPFAAARLPRSRARGRGPGCRVPTHRRRTGGSAWRQPSLGSRRRLDGLDAPCDVWSSVTQRSDDCWCMSMRSGLGRQFVEARYP